MANECPKCGAENCGGCYGCLSYISTKDIFMQSNQCLRNQLAQANARIAELEAKLNPPFNHCKGCEEPALSVMCLSCAQVTDEEQIAKNSRLKAIVEQAVKHFTDLKGRPDKAKAVLELLIKEEHNHNWLTTDERDAMQSEIAIREDYIEDLEAKAARDNFTAGQRQREKTAND